MAPWVKNPTAEAGIAAGARVQSLARSWGFKDLGLLQLLLRFSPWHRNFYMMQVRPEKKKKRQKEMEKERKKVVLRGKVRIGTPTLFTCFLDFLFLPLVLVG